MSEGAVAVEGGTEQGGSEQGGAVAAVAAATSAEAAAKTVWHEGLGVSADDAQWMEAKGINNNENPMGALIGIVKHAERLRGAPAESLIKRPSDWSDEAQVAEYRAAMGVPESAEGYGLEASQIAGQDFSPEIVSGLAHRIGATPQQAAELNAGVVEFLEQAVAAQQEERTAALSAEKAETDKAWGDQREAHELAAAKGFQALGWDADQISAVEAAIGYRGVMELGLKMGTYAAEPQRSSPEVPAQGSPFGLTPEAARKALAEKGGALMAKAKGGDQAAAGELRNLNKVAYGT